MAKGRMNAPLGATLVAGSAILYASYGIWTRLLGNTFTGYSATVARGVVVLAVMIPLAAVSGQLSNWRWRQTWKYWVASIVTGLFVWGPFYYSIVKAGIGVGVTVNYAAYVISMFALGWVFLGERFTRDKWLATALSLVGLYLVFTPNLTAGWLPLLAACLSGFNYAAGSIIIKKVPYLVLQTTVFLWVGSMISNGIMMLVLGERMPPLAWNAQWFYLVMFALAAIAASLMFIKGVKLIEAGAAGILGLLEVVFGVLFGVVLFGEHLNAMEALGIVAILAAAAIPYVQDYNAQRGTLAEPKS